MLNPKEPESTEKLVSKLVQRNMDVGDETQAKAILERINYYRLATYWWEHRLHDAEGERFKEGTSLHQIAEVYNFDSELRSAVLLGISRFEIAFRSRLASVFSLNAGSFSHLNPANFKNREKWAKTIAIIHDEYISSNEEFARHHLEKYQEDFLPPIWVTVELTTFGGLRYLYQNWSNKGNRQAVANYFGLDDRVFSSLIFHLESVRNVCAHHSRLWNRKFAIKPKLPKAFDKTFKNQPNLDPKNAAKIYNTLILLDFVNGFTGKEQSLINQINDVLVRYPLIDRTKMGFPQV